MGLRRSAAIALVSIGLGGGSGFATYESFPSPRYAAPRVGRTAVESAQANDDSDGEVGAVVTVSFIVGSLAALGASAVLDTGEKSSTLQEESSRQRSMQL